MSSRVLLKQGQSLGQVNVMPLVTGQRYGFTVKYFLAADTGGPKDPSRYIAFPPVETVFE
jgi:hypothetical protein